MFRTGRKRYCMPLRIKWWRFRSGVRFYKTGVKWVEWGLGVRFSNRSRVSKVRVRILILLIYGYSICELFWLLLFQIGRKCCCTPLRIKRNPPFTPSTPVNIRHLFPKVASLTLLCICIYNYSINFIRRAGPKRGTQRLKGARRRVLALGMKRSLRFCGCSLMGKKEG